MMLDNGAIAQHHDYHCANHDHFHVVVMITMITSMITITITRTEKEVVLYMWSLRDCKKPLRKKHRTWWE